VEARKKNESWGGRKLQRAGVGISPLFVNCDRKMAKRSGKDLGKWGYPNEAKFRDFWESVRMVVEKGGVECKENLTFIIGTGRFVVLARWHKKKRIEDLQKGER